MNAAATDEFVPVTAVWRRSPYGYWLTYTVCDDERRAWMAEGGVDWTVAFLLHQASGSGRIPVVAMPRSGGAIVEPLRDSPGRMAAA